MERRPSPSPSPSPTSRAKLTGSQHQPPSRQPPPALFRGPPSRHISNLSTRLPSSSGFDPPVSAFSKSNAQFAHPPSTPSRRPRGSADPRAISADTSAKRENDRADGLWVEMQNTLAEVELSAANRSHIFGAGHANALEELRAAQLALAQGWAKSEVDELPSHVMGHEGQKDDGRAPGAGGAGMMEQTEKGQDGVDGAKQKQQQQQQQSESAGIDESEKTRRMAVEEETQNDILLAKARREANDRYFEQVNNAVGDVVRKLDAVAAAMKKVEQESRDIWSDEESSTESLTESTTGR